MSSAYIAHWTTERTASGGEIHTGHLTEYGRRALSVEARGLRREVPLRHERASRGGTLAVVCAVVAMAIGWSLGDYLVSFVIELVHL